MFLGIDIRTSGVKAVVMDGIGNVAAQSALALRISRPHPLWAEQDPEDWWRATHAAVRGLDAELRGQIRCIGLSGQMHGATLLDAADRPLHPAILWNDGRAGDECAELEARVPAARRITGNIAMPRFTAPKILWVRHHEPTVLSRVKTVLWPRSFCACA